MRSIVRPSLSLWFIILGLLAAGWLAAEPTVREVSTTGVAMAGAESSRREAVEDALRNAVEEAMGTLVSVDLLVENRQVVDERILSRTRGYIERYRVVDEGRERGLYRVRIQATVRLGPIRDELAAIGLLMRRKQLPRLMVVVTAGGPVGAALEGKQYIDAVRNTVEEAFLEQGLRLVDYDRHARQQEIAGALGDRGRLAALARDAGAEVIAVVEATRRFDRNVSLYGSSYRFYRSNVRLRIVESGTGRLLYSGTRDGESSATLDPLHAAAETLADAGAEALLQKWSRDVSGVTTYRLTLRGADYATLQRFEAALRPVGAVAAVRRRAFAAGEARYEIDYRGTIDGLLDHLDGLESPPLSITGFSQQTVEAEVGR